MMVKFVVAVVVVMIGVVLQEAEVAKVVVLVGRSGHGEDGGGVHDGGCGVGVVFMVEDVVLVWCSW